MKIYEIDTEFFNVPIHKGKTIIKVILLEDFNRVLRENNIDFLNNEHMDIIRLKGKEDKK